MSNNELSNEEHDGIIKAFNKAISIQVAYELYHQGNKVEDSFVGRGYYAHYGVEVRTAGPQVSDSTTHPSFIKPNKD